MRDATLPISVILVVLGSLRFQLYPKGVVLRETPGALQAEPDVWPVPLLTTATDVMWPAFALFVRLALVIFQALPRAAAQLDQL